MAIRRREKRTERSKIDATPPWEIKRDRPAASTAGPFDIADMPDSDGVARLDLGPLRVPVSDSYEIRVEIDERQQVLAVTLVTDGGQLQLGLFAAPRNEGIWTEIRAEILASVTGPTDILTEQSGAFGPELVGRLSTPDGLTPVRFLGIDGPRWFLRAMLAGPVAADEPTAATGRAAELLLDAFRAVVVVRGDQPLPVREPVPLQLPAGAAEQVAEAAAGQQVSEAAAGQQVSEAAGGHGPSAGS